MDDVMQADEPFNQFGAHSLQIGNCDLAPGLRSIVEAPIGGFTSVDPFQLELAPSRDPC